MNCPKCGKALNKAVGIIEDDGGFIIQIECKKCNSTFEAFVNPIDLEEIYITDKELVS
jgi:hypothetical protein